MSDDLSNEQLRESFASFYDVMDPDALCRYRQAVLDSNGHDMAAVNHNSLRRLVTLIDRQAARITELEARPAIATVDLRERVDQIAQDCRGEVNHWIKDGCDPADAIRFVAEMANKARTALTTHSAEVGK